MGWRLFGLFGWALAIGLTILAVNGRWRRGVYLVLIPIGIIWWFLFILFAAHMPDVDSPVPQLLGTEISIIGLFAAAGGLLGGILFRKPAQTEFPLWGLHVKKWLAIPAAILIPLILAGGAYWWEHTLSHDFRKDAVDAVAELNSFKDTDACSGVLLYGFAVERISVAVHKAEAEASTTADEEAAKSLQKYYESLTDRDKNCSTDEKTIWGQEFSNDFWRRVISYDLGISDK